MSSRGRSRTPVGTKTDFFVTIANDSQPLIVVTKNFIQDATDILDPGSLSKLQYGRQISPSQCPHQALHSLCFGCAK